MSKMNRRQFLSSSGAAALGATLPLTWIELAFANPKDNISIAYISDSHIQHIKGTQFVRNWDRGLIRAVAETNLITPRPDFVVYGGDLAQLGTKEELDHGAELMSKLHGFDNVKWVMGEHDYYLDLGAYWRELFGPEWYSWDYKGVHFVTLNSILTYDKWTHETWPDGVTRMNVMAGLDDPRGSPFMVGEQQRAWLKADLAKVRKDTPIVIFSHSPLQKIFKNWNFWTEDADEIQALLKPFKQVNVVYGHVHQIQYNQIGNIAFNSVMATAWPWPYPQSYAQADNQLAKLTIPINRADPFFERDGTGWQMIDVHTGRTTLAYNLYNNPPRVVGFDAQKGHPVDKEFQGEPLLPSQVHF